MNDLIFGGSSNSTKLILTKFLYNSQMRYLFDDSMCYLSLIWNNSHSNHLKIYRISWNMEWSKYSKSLVITIAVQWTPSDRYGTQICTDLLLRCFEMLKMHSDNRVKNSQQVFSQSKRVYVNLNSHSPKLALFCTPVATFHKVAYRTKNLHTFSPRYTHINLVTFHSLFFLSQV